MPRGKYNHFKIRGTKRPSHIKDKIASTMKLKKINVGKDNPMYGTDGFWKGKTRPELSGVNHPFFNKKGPRFGKGLGRAKYYCKDCGKEVSRNSAKYGLGRCNSCASSIRVKQSYKNGKKPNFNGKRYKYNGICMRSLWEVAYAKYLDNSKIEWKYEYKKFDLGNGLTYRPDFYLVKSEGYVEIKGYWRAEAREKVRLFKKQYSNISFIILEGIDLYNLGILERKGKSFSVCKEAA